MTQIKTLLLLLMLVLVALSCKPQGKDAATGKKPGASATYLAKVNETVITKEMYDEELNSLPEQIKAFFMRQGGGEAFLNEIINKELLYQDAKKKGVENDKRLKQAVEEFKKITMVKIVLQDQVEEKTAMPTPEEIKQYYEENKENFRLKPSSKGKKGDILAFEAVKDLIEQQMVAQRQEQSFNSFMDSLKKSPNKVEINQEEVKNLN